MINMSLIVENNCDIIVGSKEALVIELKNKQAVDTAIDRIKKKNYPDKIKEYIGSILLVGITYNEDKHHECVIEKI